ncbi:unnamed protein product [Phaedon cochleariae]|uniref:Major facilitator superfamily (MFS) profile domain-containing protein n=1 Tax=Phaedon cochleariae TaxID=80249 RepID=A0A9N9X342_PHACE|nr:unnamed protein product [Phaedon cochleariae]
MKFNISSLMAGKKCRLLQYMAGIGANIGVISTYMHYGWTSPYIPVLQSGNYTFEITSDEASWLTVVILAGAILGAIVSSFAVKFLGQKFLIVFSSIPLFISWISIAVARSIVLLFIGRFLAGFADGLFFTIVPMYLSEIADPDIRGILSSLFPVFSVVGLLLMSILGAYLPIDTVGYIGTLLPILLFLTFSWMPESPYYFVSKGEIEDARRSLQKLRAKDDVNEELERISEGMRQQNDNKSSAFDLVLVKSNRRALIITLGLRGIQQLSGAPVIIFYCETIFQESGGAISSEVAAMIYFSVQLLSAAISSYIVDTTGRRPLLILSTFGASLALFVLASYFYMKINIGVDITQFSYVPVIALLCFVIVYSIGLQNIPLVMMGEIFATNVKATALGLMDIYYGILVTLTSKFFHWTNEEYGMHVPFLIFASCCLIGVIFIVLCVPETKGKSLEEIQIQLRDGKPVAKELDMELS